MFNMHWHVTRQNITGTETNSDNLGVYDTRTSALDCLDRVIAENGSEHERTSDTRLASVIYCTFSSDFFVLLHACYCERGEDELDVEKHWY
jgi:hypothetical protein